MIEVRTLPSEVAPDNHLWIGTLASAGLRPHVRPKTIDNRLCSAG